MPGKGRGGGGAWWNAMGVTGKEGAATVTQHRHIFLFHKICSKKDRRCKIQYATGLYDILVNNNIVFN